MAWTFCTSGAAIIKAGANSSQVLRFSGAELAKFSDEVEGQIMAETRRDWKTYYTSISSGATLILDDCSSDLIAMKIINYDMSGYTSRTEAQTMLDVLRDNATRNINTLKDFKSNEIKSPI